MSVKLPAVDLSAAQAGTTGTLSWENLHPGAFPTDPSGVKVPVICLYNESQCGIDISFPDIGGSTFIPAGGWRAIPVPSGETSLNYVVSYALTNAGVSKLIGVYYAPYELGSLNIGVLGNSPLNVGNSIQTSGGTNIKDDTDGPGISIIEATPTDQTSSSWAMNNDASGFLQILSAGILRKIFNFTRGNATSGKASVAIGDAGDLSILTLYGTAQQALATGIQAGALPAGVTLPANQLTAGALASGITLPATQLTSGVLPAGVTLPASQLTAGTLPNGVDLTTLYSDGGALSSDGAGHLTADSYDATTATAAFSWGASGAHLDAGQGGSIELGADNTTAPPAAQTPYIDFHSSTHAVDYDARIIASRGDAGVGDGQLDYYAAAGHGFHGPVVPNAGVAIPQSQVIYSESNLSAHMGNLNNTSDWGIENQNGDVVISSSAGTWLKNNTYFDGANDRFITAAFASQFYLINSGTGRIQWRYSTNTPSAGGVITWSAFQSFPLLTSNGGGAAGYTIFVGTTDPGGNAQEGDIWIST